MFLGLIGAPVRVIPYPAYKALKNAGGVLGNLLSAAEAKAVQSIVGSTALAVGAGIFGYSIGEAILKSLERPEVIPNPGDYFEAGNPGGVAKVTFSYYVNGDPVFSSIDSVAMPLPIKGSFYRVDAINGAAFFVRDGNGEQRNLVSTTFPVPGARLVIEGFKTAPGNVPIVPSKRVPSTLPNNPNPQPIVPVPLPVPGSPDFPITPEVVPNPDNDPNQDDKEVQPGVIVKIPETGSQIRFTPDGVSIGRYKSPDTLPFEVPQPDLPDTNKRVASPPCPCPEPDLSEVVCRIETLQDEILDDGYNSANTVTAIDQSGIVTGIANEIQVVRVVVLSQPSNSRVQPSSGAVPDVLFIGWFSWVYNGRPGERVPIHFADTSFTPDRSANGFIFQLYSGCTGQATYTTRIKRPYIDAC